MQVYIGIDWSSKKHDVVITDKTGKQISADVIEHSQEGFAKVEQMRKRLGVSQNECVVGLETAHTLLIDFLWENGYEQLRVIHPNIVNKSRERYRQSGAYDDQSDAFVISDLLRTDGHRFTPWQPGHRLGGTGGSIGGQCRLGARCGAFQCHDYPLWGQLWCRPL